MGWNDHIDWDLDAIFSDLEDEGLLVKGTSAHGICQQIIHSGYDSLSEKQSYVFKKEVEPALIKRAKALETQRIIDSNPD